MAKLETEVAELLCCFWLAKQGGYNPSVLLPTHIHAQSPASSLILSDLVKPLLFEGNQRIPLLLAPYGYHATVDFEEAQGTTVPKIYRTLLQDLEKPQLPPLSRAGGDEVICTPISIHEEYISRHQPLQEKNSRQVPLQVVWSYR